MCMDFPLELLNEMGFPIFLSTIILCEFLTCPRLSSEPYSQIFIISFGQFWQYSLHSTIRLLYYLAENLAEEQSNHSTPAFWLTSIKCKLQLLHLPIHSSFYALNSLTAHFLNQEYALYNWSAVLVQSDHCRLVFQFKWWAVHFRVCILRLVEGKT